MKTVSQLSAFGDERLSISDSLRLTADSLNTYGAGYAHWALAYSGGKDSSTALTAVVHLIRSGAVTPPKSLTILYADTRMELPPLHRGALEMLSILDHQGYSTRVVLPEMDDRFMVYMLGRGVPPPSNTFRWCTSQLKVEPMEKALRELHMAAGQKFLMLTGVRVGESAARDARIALSCGKAGSECGQGWFQQRPPDQIADTLAPILHWRACHVWDWLMGDARVMGFPTALVADAYGMADDGTPEAIGARTGCVGCNLASRDLALERLVAREKYAYLAPLLRLRPLYAELKKPHNRLRKQDERRQDGSQVSNPGRLGPLTMEARRYGLQQVIDIQDAVACGAPANATLLGGTKYTSSAPYDLIDFHERLRILELIQANTWPDKWDGTEVTGDTLLPVDFSRNGGRQITLLEMFDAGRL